MMKKILNVWSRLMDAYHVFVHGRFYIWSLYNKDLNDKKKHRYVPTYKYFKDKDDVPWRLTSLETGGFSASSLYMVGKEYRWIGDIGIGNYQEAKSSFVEISKEMVENQFPNSTKDEITGKRFSPPPLPQAPKDLGPNVVSLIDYKKKKRGR